MTRIDALRALEEVVDAGTLTDRGNEHWLAAMPRKTWEHIVKANSGSLDAAKALHEALLPNHSWDIWRGIGPDCVKYYGCNIPGIDTVYVADPARAWLIAIIRAMIAQEEGAWGGVGVEYTRTDLCITEAECQRRIDAAVQAEREECAITADLYEDAEDAADAIRARGQK